MSQFSNWRRVRRVVVIAFMRRRIITFAQLVHPIGGLIRLRYTARFRGLVRLHSRQTSDRIAATMRFIFLMTGGKHIVRRQRSPYPLERELTHGLDHHLAPRKELGVRFSRGPPASR